MRVLTASDSALIRQQLQKAVLEQGLNCAGTTIAQLPANVEGAHVVLLAVGVDIAGALTAIHGCGPSPVFVVCDESNIADVPCLLRAGAKGYVRFEHLTNDFDTILQELRETGGCEVAWGRVIAVTGALAGVGVTTVATNLAFALAATHPGRVALVQITDNDLALNLNLQPTYPLAELAAGWCRLDTAILKRRMVDHPAGISVLAEQAGQSSGVAWSPAALRQVLNLLRSRFDFVIADFGHVLDVARLEAVRFADDVVLVQRLDTPTVEMTKEFVGRLGTERIVGVINRYGQEQQLDWQQVQETMHLSVAEWLPDDPARVNHALNSRRSLIQVAAEAPITRSFTRLASRWTHTATATQTEECWLEVG